MSLTTHSFFIELVAVMIGSLGIIVFLGSKEISSRYFAISIFWVTLWIILVGLLYSTQDTYTALFLSRVNYYLGSVISVSFVYFFLTFPENKRPHKILWRFICIIQILLLYIYINTEFIISDIYRTSESSWGWSFGSLYPFFELVFFGCFLIGIYILIRKYKLCKDPNTKSNLKFMILTIILGAIPPSIVSIILPHFNYYDLDWIGPISQIIWIPVMTYSIIKYRQMNVITVFTEALAVGLISLFFINIFTNTSNSLYFRTAIFITFLILVIYIIKISLSESHQRSLLKDLNENLSQKVAEQTAEVRHAYDLEKKAHRELVKLNETKDQFIMITQHNLRTPVTSIRWEIESILSGTHGKISDELKQTLTDTNSSIETLTRMVDDFLNIASLKTGAQILNTTMSNIKPILEAVLKDLRIDIEQMNIKIEVSDTVLPDALIDVNKIHEVLLIIIENAIKYNNRNGAITINMITKNDSIEITISNTGVGITKEEQENIADKLFYRGQKAKSTHPGGMGIGLSVSKAIVQAHHGELWIRSNGEDEGASVTIKIPLNFMDTINLSF